MTAKTAQDRPDPMIPKGYSLPQSMHEQVAQTARTKDRSVSYMLREIIRFYYDSQRGRKEKNL
jgi:hypothetical protein